MRGSAYHALLALRASPVMPSQRYLLTLLGIVLAVLLWSGIGPFDRPTWLLEVAPGLIGLVVLAVTYRSFPLTRLTYLLIAVHVVILCVGGHYTYAKVPAFDWLAEALGRTRNDYDKVGHFWQGFGPAIVAREVILRTSPLRPGKWLFFLVLCFALAVSAVYELIEWGVALLSEEAADAFLGTQGDVWDTQKDMFTCGIGATLALVGLTRLHDRQLDDLVEETRGSTNISGQFRARYPSTRN
jgi:putative membrane protein